MPALLKRIAFEVNGSLMEETLTITSESTDGHYISLRPLLNPTKEQEAYPFEWAFIGTNKDVEVSKISEDKVQQIFNFPLDSNKYLKVANIHEGPVYTQWQRISNGVLQETGNIYPFGKDKEPVNFMEMWQPIDIHSEQLVLADGSKQRGRSVVLKIDNNEYFGMIFAVGKWVQGMLSKKNESTTKGLSFVRTVDTSYGTVNTLIKYGADFDKFPTLFDGLEKGVQVNANGINWEVIEANY